MFVRQEEEIKSDGCSSVVETPGIVVETPGIVFEVGHGDSVLNQKNLACSWPKQ